jgi:hypothetical protein
MCRQPRNVRQTSRHISTSASSATYSAASLTHVMKLAAHSTKPPTPTTMVQSFIMTLYIYHYLNIKNETLEGVDQLY